jgi:hypothetical protein
MVRLDWGFCSVIGRSGLQRLPAKSKKSGRLITAPNSALREYDA